MGVLRKQVRRLLSAPFLLDGVETLRDPAPRAKELAPTVHRLAQRYSWLPDDPELLVRAQGATALAGGALLVTGKAGRLGCLLLAVQSVPTLYARYRGFRDGDPAEQGRARADAVKDVSLFSALLLVATEPKKRPSHLRWEAEHMARRARHTGARTRRRVERKARSTVGRLGR
ncbi:DoxX family membrane protein [Marinactinospora thermotolerans]|uniref:DoxX protein n=1 Tax=Marinactinospora thermotolerans DSM 45154 TaxID=1122192 RepID=A0A1T4SDU2_9ACTN|nr:DoxX family membrane protein [Marinactinospora thermotolerans]SKA26031.1 DoxX protein [Marinactinospora thermotolerans DSM 45154]